MSQSSGKIYGNGFARLFHFNYFISFYFDCEIIGY